MKLVLHIGFLLFFLRSKIGRLLGLAKNITHVELTPDEQEQVDYACNLSSDPAQGAVALGDLRPYEKTSYGYDVFRQAASLPPQIQVNFLFGDVKHEPDEPTFVKSRPIVHGRASTSILLPMDCFRHLYHRRDPFAFEEKKNAVVWRGAAHQAHRQLFLKNTFGKDRCDIANVAKLKGLEPYTKRRMSIRGQMRYRFIISLEGNDVASNLFWILCSNSVAFVPPPRYEVWAQPGRLVAETHYVPIAADGSDLVEKLDYYGQRPDVCKQIVENAHAYADPFKNLARQYQIGQAVILQYARQSGQLD